MSQHAIDRAKERYGLSLTPGDIRAIRDAIDCGEAVLLKRGDGIHGGHYLVKHEGQVLRVVYDPETRAVTTILPKDAGLRAPQRKKKGKGRRYGGGDRGKRPDPKLDMDALLQ